MTAKNNTGNHKHPQCSQPETDGCNDDKRMRMMAERDDPPAVDSAPLKSKEYIAESAQHIYRTHTCPTCRRCFKLRSHLQEHLHLHFPDPSLQCPTCKRYFTSKSKLRIHRLREAGEKVHRCHLCEYSAVEQNAIRRHLVSMHADAPQTGINSQSYPCPTCGQGFHQSRSLKAHMKMHSKMTASMPVVCFQEACSFQSSVRKELLRHTVEVHGVKAVECRHHACGAIFQKEADMEIHYRTHLAYHCSQCDFSCSNKALFLQHRRHGHAGTDQLSCEFCSYVTFNPVEFEQHLEHLHANEKIHRCSQCTYTTSHKRGLKRHRLMHSGEKPHKCSICDFRCRDESYLSKHMLTHSDDKNFMCADCGYVTKWKHYLNVHMRKHAGDLRYQCDQCPYRCHRMDQLNSHKLRHQAKSLMCEICAYSCKRKYELRHHMLVKHSGEEKQPSVYQCKYCKYTTCYRQALKNHENCKHTKLTEFHCALCFYSSFSSVSLFLHKRKAHGYVPGDKKWLENYAAKEERNSTKFMQDFYTKLSSGQQQSEQSSEGQRASPQTREQSELSGAIGKQTLSKSLTTVEAVSVFDEVGNGVISESPPPVSSQEEYCTLILTTLPAAHYQTPSVQYAEENCANKTPPKMKTSDSCLKNVDSSTSTTSSGEDSAAMPQQACEIHDKDDSDEPLDNTRGIVASDSEKIRPNWPQQMDKQLETEVRLNALKKHDKDQAEAMVLEGRVQMLVVPTKHADMHRVEMRENGHCQTLCHGKKKEHKCEACGSQFKQQRSLDSHVAKKCLVHKRKARAVVGKICPLAEESCSLSTEGFPEVIDSNQSAPFSQNPQTDSKDQEVHQQEEQACSSHLAVCKGFDDCGPLSTELAHQPLKSQIIKPLKVQSVKKQLVPGIKDNGKSLQKKPLYTEKDGRFECKLCKFSSVRLATVERHVAACQNKSRKTGNRVFSGGQEALADECTKGTQKELSDSNCVLKHCQKTASGCHKKCLNLNKKKKFDSAKATHLHCQQCNFTCKQKRCMAQHVALKHQGVRPHRCRYCPFATTRHYRLEEHESLHTGIGRHKCDLCDKTFGAVTKLRQHKLRIHDKQPTQFCSLCDFSGYTLDDVKRHNIRCHTGVLKHACSDCDAGFSSGSALRNHCKRVHPLQVRFSCKQCDYTCSSEVTLKSHQQSKHRQESFSTKKRLETHQRSCLAHQCQLCPFATKTRKLFVQHLLSDHEEGPPEDKPLKCSSCHFACRHQLVLEHHLRSHGGRRLYRCRDCEYSTRNKQKITWHVRIHTGEKPYSCEQCNYSCTDPSRLKLHMRVHQEEKKYLCPECGYKCKWATQLKYHMTKHTGEKPYACDECDYRTNRADALRAHRDTQHCDLRPYVCEKCGKAFKTSFILKTHQRQHSDDRPYTCGLCHKAFRWPAGLRHHYLSHTKQQPFCCRHCSYRAKQRFQVVKHLQRHHPEMSVEQGVVRHSETVSLTLKEALQGTLGVRAAEVEKEATVVAAVVAEELVQRGEDSETKGL